MNSGEEDDYNHLVGIGEGFYPEKLFSHAVTEKVAIDKIFKRVINETPNLNTYATKEELMEGFNDALFQLARKTANISSHSIEKIACLLSQIRTY